MGKNFLTAILINALSFAFCPAMSSAGTIAYFSLHGTCYSYGGEVRELSSVTFFTGSINTLQLQLQQIGGMDNFPLPLGGVDRYDLIWETNFPFQVAQHWESDGSSGITSLTPYTTMNPSAEFYMPQTGFVSLLNESLLQGTLTIGVGLTDSNSWGSPVFSAMTDYQSVPEPASVWLVLSGLLALSTGVSRRQLKGVG